MISLEPTPEEVARRGEVLARVVEATRANATIKLPPYDPAFSVPSSIALASVGIEPNPFGGTIRAYRYQFEGEEDLLHLFVCRRDGGTLSVREGQEVADFLLAPVPKALIWLRPGDVTQHFYLGHDDLLAALGVSAPSAG